MLLAAGSTRAAIIGILTAEYDADPDQIAGDAEALLAELAARGLVIAEPPGPPR